MEKNQRALNFQNCVMSIIYINSFCHWDTERFLKKICINYKFWASFLFLFDVCLVINTRKFQILFSLLFNTRTSLIQIQQGWQESVLHTFQNSYLRCIHYKHDEMRHLWSNKALCLCFWLIFVIKHKKCKIPLIFIAILQVYDCIYKRGKK